MDVRRLVLRLSLTCLGITALSAMVLVFVPLTGLVGRFTLSGAFATITGIVCLPFAHWASRDDLRWGGLAGVVFMCVEFLLALTLMWGGILFPGANGDRVAGTMIDLLIIAPTCIAGARALGGPSRAAGICAVACGVVALLLNLGDTWFYGGLFGPQTSSAGTAFRGYGTTVIVAGSAAALGLVRARFLWPRWPFAATVLAVVGGGLSTYYITSGWTWNNWVSDDFERMGKLASSFLIGAFAIGGANFVLLPKLGGRGTLVQVGTAGMVGLASALFIVAMWTESEEFWTAFAASCIALLCGVIAVPILSRFFHEPELVRDRTILATIELVCPRCRRRGTVALGASSCESCGLRFRIDVEEPRCAGCGQLLVGSHSDRCPECGRVTAQPPESAGIA